MHEMRLNNEPFEKIKNGSKKIELRLNDEKRRLVKIGDIIEFTNLSNNDKLRVKVTNLYRFDSFKELFNNIDNTLFGHKDNNKDNYKVMSKYYSKEEEKKYGVLGIEIELIGDEKYGC